MGNINGTQRLAGNSRDLVEFDTGVFPGIRANDTFANAGPLTFTVASLGASLFSGTAQALFATGATGSDPGRTREILGTLIRELIREGVIKGTYTL